LVTPRMYECMYICMYVRTYVCVCMYVCVSTYICVCVCVYNNGSTKTVRTTGFVRKLFFEANMAACFDLALSHAQPLYFTT
jgi:hypothetical protein